MADLESGLLRLIGDPETRYREDPVRMLRATRFATKLGFRLHPDTEDPIKSLAPLLADIPPARLFEEAINADDSLRDQCRGLVHEGFDILAILRNEQPVSFVIRDVNGYRCEIVAMLGVDQRLPSFAAQGKALH